jgi:hypothetical protein
VNDPVRAALLTALLGLGSLAVLLVVVLVLVRATGEALERRAGRRRDELRRLILTALLGEPEESGRARGDLLARQGHAWRQVEKQAFAMLPKIKGDSHDALVSLLRGRGAAERALRSTGARSLVRRSRGAYELGALGDRSAVPTLLGLLGCHHFLVRRTAVRALGHVGDPVAVTPLLDAVSAEPALARDVVAALQRIGPAAAENLRLALAGLVESEETGRRGALVATVLGLHGDLAAVDLLDVALRKGRQPGLRAAAAQALGEIGSRAAVPGLVAALAADEPEVKAKAAVALGQIGDASAVPGLSSALGAGEHTTERAVAAALLRLGRDGLAALEQHSSPYATEALAVHGMRTPA